MNVLEHTRVLLANIYGGSCEKVKESTQHMTGHVDADQRILNIGLMAAAACGNLEMTKLLVDSGATNGIECAEISSRFLAKRQQRNKEVVEYLLDSFFAGFEDMN